MSLEAGRLVDFLKDVNAPNRLIFAIERAIHSGVCEDITLQEYLRSPESIQFRLCRANGFGRKLLQHLRDCVPVIDGASEGATPAVPISSLRGGSCNANFEPGGITAMGFRSNWWLANIIKLPRERYPQLTLRFGG